MNAKKRHFIFNLPRSTVVELNVEHASEAPFLALRGVFSFIFVFFFHRLCIQMFPAQYTHRLPIVLIPKDSTLAYLDRNTFLSILIKVISVFVLSHEMKKKL